MARSRKFAKQTVTGRTAKYGLTGVPRGSLIALCNDPYGRWELGHRTGKIERRASMTVWIEFDDGTLESFNEGDIRYLVDTGRARITAAPRQTILDEKRLP